MNKNRHNRLQAPIGSSLNVKDYMFKFVQLHEFKKPDTKFKIKEMKKQIIGCANKNEFAEPLLNEIEKCYYSDSKKNNTLYLNLIVVSRKICSFWTQEQKKSLIKMCIGRIRRHLNMSLSYTNNKNYENYLNSIIESINTIGILGTEEDAVLIDKIKSEKKFYQSCLYAFSNIQMNIDWIYEQFRVSIKNNEYIQQTVWAMGIALRRNGKVKNSPAVPLNKVVDYICKIIKMQDKDTINVAVTALGVICDKRYDAIDTVSEEITQKAIEVLDEFEIILSGNPSFETANKLVKGIQLNDIEEKYLLEYIEHDS